MATGTSPDDDKVRALATYLEHLESDISHEYGDVYSSGREEYLVLIDDEADQAWDESLDSYLDDCVLPELPATAQQYFDRDAWKHDARYDGRGHCLSPYDGEEHEVKVDGVWFYIYRVN